MSFSSDVRTEISREISSARHCCIAEISAIILFSGKIEGGMDDPALSFSTENASVARKYFTLLKKTFIMNVEVAIRRNNYLHKSNIYTLSVNGENNITKLLAATKMDIDDSMRLVIGTGTTTQLVCCKRAFLRGAFLASGSISDPERFYHFEIVCSSSEKAGLLMAVMNSLELEPKTVVRKNTHIVYLKESEQIVKALALMGANQSFMKVENIRILKDMRNSVNRQVNCEIANIGKVISASMRQVADIEYIQSTVGFDSLPEGLAQIANLRLQHKDLSLKELGEMLDPKIGKSGVNHRLRKLAEIADTLRQKET